MKLIVMDKVAYIHCKRVLCGFMYVEWIKRA